MSLPSDASPCLPSSVPVSVFLCLSQKWVFSLTSLPVPRAQPSIPTQQLLMPPALAQATTDYNGFQTGLPAARLTPAQSVFFIAARETFLNTCLNMSLF